jgi:hypothetical protein
LKIGRIPLTRHAVWRAKFEIFLLLAITREQGGRSKVVAGLKEGR